MPTFNLLDIGFILVLVLFTLRGGIRGLIAEVTGLIGIVIAIFATKNFYHFLLPTVQKNLNVDPFFQHCIAYIALFCLILFAVFILGKILHQFIKINFSDWANHILGCAVGLVKGICICSFALAVLMWMVPQTPFLEDSFFTEFFEQVIYFIKSFLPTTTE